MDARAAEYLDAGRLTNDDNRLILNDRVMTLVRKKLESDSLVIAYYQFLSASADSMLEAPLLQRKLSGGNMLRTSYEGLRRLTTLALIFNISKDEKYLLRLEREMESILSFSDWNPEHFLDVGEMSLGVALAFNWCGEYFDDELRRRIEDVLRFHITMTFEPGPGSRWLIKGNNWNQVCQAGIIASALALNDSSVVERVLPRGIDNLATSMKSYGPDGAFLEGPTYWGYGTVFTAFLITILESRFGHDFGLLKYPGFFDSATYRLMMNGNSGRVFNYSDADVQGFGLSTREILFFFGFKTGDEVYINRQEVLELVRSEMTAGRNPSRYAAIALLWLVQFEPKQGSKLPVVWTAHGKNSVGVIKDAEFYLGVKGGQANLPHGHMDAGSFVLEIDGVRWSLDMGNQSYFETSGINKIDQWNYQQNSSRWKLLSKNNFGHSTITVDNEKHRVSGLATVDGFMAGDSVQDIVVDMKMVLGENVSRAIRYFSRKRNNSLIITDSITFEASEFSFRWQMITDADVELGSDQAILSKGGRRLRLKILYPETASFELVSLDPPPRKFDKRIRGLKRLEINISSSMLRTNFLESVVKISPL